MKKNTLQVRNIWFLTREYGDIAGAGGVKDVTAQLSRTLAKWSGRKVRVVLPLYGSIDEARYTLEKVVDPDNADRELRFLVEMNYVDHERVEAVTVWRTTIERVTLYFLDSPRFREKRDVYTYTAEDERNDPTKRRGEGHYDYFATNLLLQKSALQLIMLLREHPDVIHCHDGHTAVVPALIAETPWLRSYFRKTGCLVTLHNGGKGYHQEVADLPFAQAMTGLPWRVIQRCRLQNSFDPLVAAGLYGIINTVSENYARELQETWEDEKTGWIGHHLRDLGIRIEGVTNGVDPEILDPRRGEAIGIPASYDPRDDGAMAGKKVCRRELLDLLAGTGEYSSLVQHGTLQLADDVPLFAFVGRLSEQKGVDILVEAVQHLTDEKTMFGLVVLGSGPQGIEQDLVNTVRQAGQSRHICFLKGYDPVMANRIFSASDFFVVPSRFEPCGLTDFIAQLFGSLPVVHGVGGLVKVRDRETGIRYSDNSPEGLARAMKQAADLFQDSGELRRMQKRAVEVIEACHTWKVVMREYLELYKRSIELQMERQYNPI